MKRVTIKPQNELFDCLSNYRPFKRKSINTSKNTVSLISALSGHAFYDYFRGTIPDNNININDVIKVRTDYIYSLLLKKGFVCNYQELKHKQLSPPEKKELSNKLVNLLIETSDSKVKEYEDKLKNINVTIID